MPQIGTDRALLLQEQLFGGSGGAALIDHGEVISIHVDNAMVTKTSPSAKVTIGCIACQSSSTLPTR